MFPEEKQNFQKFQKIIAWRRQKWSDRILMLSFRKIFWKNYTLLPEIPAKYHYDSIQAFDSNKY